MGALSFAGEPRGDRKIVLDTVKQDGCAIMYAAKELRADRDVVLKAVEKDWRALAFVEDGLREDREIVLAGARQDMQALKYTSPELRDDKEFVAEAEGAFEKYQERKKKKAGRKIERCETRTLRTL